MDTRQEKNKKNIFLSTDEKYMRRCLQLATNGRHNVKSNPMVGAVLVCRDRIIGEGYHVCFGKGHAEVNCFASVKSGDVGKVRESTLYVSLEPCSHQGKTPPCADLIIEKQVKRVVVGCVDPFAKVRGQGIKKIADSGIEVSVGVLEEECLALNKRFVTYHEYHRPYILLKWAQTSNGFIDDNFHPLQISTPFTTMLSHKLRAENEAILVGKATDEREHPRLDVRCWHGDNPLRLVLSGGNTIEELLSDLYGKNIQSLVVEGGRKTLQSFIDAGLWDEIRVETAPAVVGNGTRSPLLPENIRLISAGIYDGNTINRYAKKK